MTGCTPTAAAAGDAGALQVIERIGGPALVRTMLTAFLRDAPRRIAAAQDALRAGNIAGAQAAAHAMKSSAGQLGARGVQALSTQIEHSSDAPAMAGWIEEVRLELERYVVWLGDRAPRATEGKS